MIIFWKRQNLSKIDKLTNLQQKQLIAHREEYLQHGLSCEPCDKKKAESAIIKMYKRIEMAPPYFWHCDSPIQQQMVICLLKNNLWANLRENLRANLRENLRENLGDNLRDNLGDNLRDNLRDNLWDNLWANLVGNLGASDFSGNFGMFWLSYYVFAEKYLGVDYGCNGQLLQLWDDIGKSCGWWYPYKNICIISDRPKEINKKGIQLHCETGPAISYR